MTGTRPLPARWVEPAQLSSMLEPRVRMGNRLLIGMLLVAILSAIPSFVVGPIPIPWQIVLLMTAFVTLAILFMVVPRVWPRRFCFIHASGMGRNLNWSPMAMRYWKWAKISHLTITTVQAKQQTHRVLNIHGSQGKHLGRLGLPSQVDNNAIAAWASAMGKPLTITQADAN